ncbi:MAG: hypothetical protein AB2A00_12235 [Myxococcota bacterium]
MDALADGCADVPVSVDATFSWYFRDEDRWLTVESRAGSVMVRPGLTEAAEMKFYSASVADFIHQHATEGAGRAIFQGGGFYWRGDINRLKAISPLCRSLFGAKLHQRLQKAGISVPKFEARRYPARTKAQRDRILAEWVSHGERSSHLVNAPSRPPPPRVVSPVVSTSVGAPAPVVTTSVVPSAGRPQPRRSAPSKTPAVKLTRGTKAKATARSAKTLRKR